MHDRWRGSKAEISGAPRPHPALVRNRKKAVKAEETLSEWHLYKQRGVTDGLIAMQEDRDVLAAAFSGSSSGTRS